MNTYVKYICVADTETGGLPNKSKKAFYDVALCEVAIVVIDCIELKIVDEYSAIIKPYSDTCEYSEQAAAVNGLSKEYLEQNGLPVKQVYSEVKALLKKYTNSRVGAVLCGHNFQLFDVPFFEGLFAYHNDNLWDYVKFIEDTMKLAYYRHTTQENYKLGTCCKAEGVELVDAHRALADTKANALLMVQYLKSLRGTGEAVTAKAFKKSRFRESFSLV